MTVVDFTSRPGAIDGLVIVTMKQVTDERGTVRELFRRSAFADAGTPFGQIDQINVTLTHLGGVRGMHAEEMTKLVAVAHGRAHGVYVEFAPVRRPSGWSTRSTSNPASRSWCPAVWPTASRRSPPDTQYAYCFDPSGYRACPVRRSPRSIHSSSIGGRCRSTPTIRRMISAKDRSALTFAPTHQGSAVMKLFVTGAAGFIGSNYVRHVLATTDHSITILDALTYAGNLESIRDVLDDSRTEFVHADICDADAVATAMDGHDAVVHFAAESHVDRSIKDGSTFVRTNCTGTNVLCDVANSVGVGKFLHISTDEVYGSVEEGSSVETDILAPRSPYSAAKAGSDLIALVVLLHLRPPGRGHAVLEQLRPVPVPREGHPAVHDEPARRQAGAAVRRRAQRARLDPRRGPQHRRPPRARAGNPGEIYNIGAGNEVTNVDLTNRLLELTGRDESFIGPVEDRLGHDRRYSVNIDKVSALGWTLSRTFEDSLESTVELVPGQPRLVGATQAQGRALTTSGPREAAGHRRRRPARCRSRALRRGQGDDVIGRRPRGARHHRRRRRARLVAELRPDAVINAAAYTAVDACETNVATAFAVNADAVGHLASACAGSAPISST